MNMTLLLLWLSVIGGVATLVVLAIFVATGMKNRTLQRLAGVCMLVTIAAFFGSKYA